MADVPHDAVTPFSIDRLGGVLLYFRFRLIEIIKRITLDEDGDVPPMDGEALHSDLLCLLTDIEDEVSQLVPLINYKQ